MTQEQEKRLAELEARVNVVLVSPGSGKAQGQRALELLAANGGQVTSAQLSAINPKYPSDPIYFARKEFGAVIATVRARGGKSTYKLLASPAEARELASLRAMAASKAPSTSAPSK